MGRRRRAGGAAWVGVWVAAAGGCASAETTRFGPAEIIATTGELREALAASSFLASRGADSPPAVLLPLEFENGSSERIGRVDQWAMMTRVLHAPGMIDTLRAHNVRVRVAPEREAFFERFAIAEEAGGGEVRFLRAGEAPTHGLRMSVESVTRLEGEGRGTVRRDLYQVEVEIMELATRRVVWSGLTDVRRVAHRSILD